MTPRAPLEAVVFDAGGTLIRLDFEWMSDDLAAHGMTIDALTLRVAELHGRRAYDGSAGAPGGARGRAYFGGTLRAAGVPEAQVDSAVDRFLERERRKGLWCRPMEGARRALDRVRQLGLRAAVVSNSDGRAEHHLSNADMLRGIEFVVDSHLVGIEKPDPAIFAVALDRLGTAPERTLFVGDIRSVDEAGARSAGMWFVLLDPSGDYAAPGSPRISGMEELAAWVETTFQMPDPPSSGAPAPNDLRLEGGMR